jgi:hypothetical protein
MSSIPYGRIALALLVAAACGVIGYVNVALTCAGDGTERNNPGHGAARVRTRPARWSHTRTVPSACPAGARSPRSTGLHLEQDQHLAL